MDLLVLLVALAAAWCCGDPVTTTAEPTTTTNTTNTTTTEASKGKRTIDQQLGYGANDLQSRFQAAQPQQRRQAARGYYPQPELFLRPQEDGQQLFAPLFGGGEVQAPLYPGYSPHQAFSSPLIGAQLPRLVPVVILRLHPTPAGPQIAQAFPALLHAPAPARPRVSLQPLQSLLLQQQYRPEQQQQYLPEQQQRYLPGAPEELVHVAAGQHKPVFGRKKPAAGKPGDRDPSYRPFKDQQ